MEISAALAKIPPASAELLARRELQRRVDTKFVLGADRVPDFIAQLADYAVLAVGDSNIATYRNLYFDTPALQYFHDHRRGRRIRRKVRIRHYPDRALSFLEIKTKQSTFVTAKRRRAIAFEHETLGADDGDFLAAAGVAFAELVPILRVDYRRIALVNTVANERLTIDFELTAEHAGAGVDRPGFVGRGTRINVDFGRVAVVEVKRAPDERPHTAARRALATAGVRERSLSKYCAALVLLSPDVRHNRLLPTLRVLEAYRSELQ